mgnify:CR=1 FL=1
MYYHGTNLNAGLSIAKSQAILSPWYVQILRFENFHSENNNSHCPDLSNSRFKEQALKVASSLYGDYELEHRVKSVSITSEFKIAKEYALNFENYSGLNKSHPEPHNHLQIHHTA